MSLYEFSTFPPLAKIINNALYRRAISGEELLQCLLLSEPCTAENELSDLVNAVQGSRINLRQFRDCKELKLILAEIPDQTGIKTCAVVVLQ